MICYLGMVVGASGFLCFTSTFVSAASSFGDFTNFEARGRSMATRAVVVMVMMITGGALAGVGRMGLAGSGIKLDPQEARKDVEPWARMTGGVVKMLSMKRVLNWAAKIQKVNFLSMRGFVGFGSCARMG